MHINRLGEAFIPSFFRKNLNTIEIFPFAFWSFSIFDAIYIIIASVFVFSFSSPALADCTQTGSSVYCEGVLSDYNEGIVFTYDEDGVTDLEVVFESDGLAPDDGNPAVYLQGEGESLGDDGVDVSLTIEDLSSSALETTDANTIWSSANGRRGFNGDDSGGIAGFGGSGGNGGDAGQGQADLDLFSVSVTGDSVYGIYLSTNGGDAGDAGDAYGLYGEGGSGGHGGSGGSVNGAISGDSGVFTITTEGSAAHGIFAEAIGGDGGNGGDGIGVDGVGGNGGYGGDGGTIELTIDGAVVVTSGEGSQGILAQSYGGAGGDGGDGDGVNGDGGADKGAGDANSVYVSLAGSVTTTGEESSGILVQSVGGFAGSSGDSVGFVAYSSNSESAGSGGAVTLVIGSSTSVDGAITTTGDGSYGLIAQSVGGGGGQGGTAISGYLALGSDGSAGGDGGAVSVENAADISTSGSQAVGMLAQSVGGGGGDSGLATSIVALGGDGGSGGNGGSVTVVNTGDIATAGESSDGIEVMSIGGGGGGAYITAGNFTVGGSGGDGGDGGTASLENTGSVTTTFASTDDDGNGGTGVRVQSIGGGGGDASTVVEVSDTIEVAIGGDGGNGGDGGDAQYTDNDDTDYLISTQGSNAPGVMVQSIGGGGGNGGLLASVGSSTINASTVLGAQGGDGGYGSSAAVSFSGTIETSGSNSNGISAQSIGGGGGNSGAIYQVTGPIELVDVSTVHGGDAGTGGLSGSVSVTMKGAVSTSGEGADGILAQSIAGGGGNGNKVISVTELDALTINSVMGADGGDGGSSGVVEVYGSGSVVTTGSSASGVTAQSLAGGGGAGALVVSGDLVSAATVGTTLGGDGAAGGNAGSVSVDYSGDIGTSGSGSSAILAQSLGGSGGASSVTIKAGIEFLSSLSVTLGGDGGDGGSSGNVSVTSTGDLSTAGDSSYGILAQSLSGDGGSADFTSADSIGSIVAFDFVMGGDGGNGSYSEAVAVQNEGAITTTGSYSDGILAQSIAGDGGATGTVIAGGLEVGSFTNSLIAEIAIGGSGGEGGRTAELVTVDNFGSIATAGDYSSGLAAQNLAGDGGNSGYIVAGVMELYPDAGALEFAISIGGDAGDGNNAEGLEILNDGAITTSGYKSFGIFGQSIGGNGGTANDSLAGITSVTEASIDSAFSMGGTGGDSGVGGAVSVENYADVSTAGYYSDAIYLQSIGGGGGEGGTARALIFDYDASGTFPDPNFTIALASSVGGSGGTGNHGGTVAVSNYGTLVTASGAADGIFAQSVGGGGGDAGEALTFIVNTGSNFEQSYSANVSVGGSGGVGGDGGDVSVVNDGVTYTFGDAASGIYTQSIGGGGGNGADSTAYANFVSNRGSWVPSASVSVGGDGGAAGDGGAISVSNSASLNTEGNVSYGIFSQSVGGGGGAGGNGNYGTFLWLPSSGQNDVTETIGDLSKFSQLVELAIVVGGAGESAGDGGDIQISNSGHIFTTGNSSTGIYVQSIGGGGGVSGDDTFAETYTLFTFGGGSGHEGNGGEIEIGNSGEINTSGIGAMGVFAQSVGASGGTAGDFENSLDAEFENLEGRLGIIDVSLYSGNTDAMGDDVTITTTSSITTTGAQAHGIFAQSVGGGGGAKELGTDDADDDWAIGSLGEYGNGGLVSISVSADISVSGEGATAIFAQSAGGFISVTDGVSIEIDGNVSATGERGRAIVAQSVASSNERVSAPGSIDITVSENGSVSASSDAYETIVILNGYGNTLTNYGTITKAEVEGTAGYALKTDAYGDIAISNYGTFTGSVSTDGGSQTNSFVNFEGGTFNSGYEVDLGANSSISNFGNFSPGSTDNIITSVLTADLTQESTGNYIPDVSIDDGTGDVTADLLFVTGSSVSLAGTISPNVVSGSLPETGASGSMIVLQAADSGLTTLTATVVDSATVDYEIASYVSDEDVTINDETYSDVDTVELSYSVDYSGTGSALATGNTARFANTLSRLAGLAKTMEKGSMRRKAIEELAVAALNAESLSDLGLLYESHIADESAAGISAAFSSAFSIHSMLQSCPRLKAQPTADFYKQQNCYWGQAFGTSADYERNDYHPGYSENSFGFSAGIQTEFRPDWFIEFAGLYEDVRADGNNFTQDGYRFGVGVALKKELGAITLSSSASGGFFGSNYARQYTTGAGTFLADSNIFGRFVGGELRVSSVLPLADETYFRPALALHGSWVWQNGFNERGSGNLNQSVDAISKGNLVVRPSFEFGRAFEIDGKATVAFVRGGAGLYLTDPDVTVNSHFSDLGRDLGGLSSELHQDDVFGELDAGINIQLNDRLSMSLEGRGRYSENASSLGGVGRIRLSF